MIPLLNNDNVSSEFHNIMNDCAQFFINVQLKSNTQLYDTCCSTQTHRNLILKVGAPPRVIGALNRGVILNGLLVRNPNDLAIEIASQRTHLLTDLLPVSHIF
jgi:hypothetical protein